jgi:hypothetical protein
VAVFEAMNSLMNDHHCTHCTHNASFLAAQVTISNSSSSLLDPLRNL